MTVKIPGAVSGRESEILMLCKEDGKIARSCVRRMVRKPGAVSGGE